MGIRGMKQKIILMLTLMLCMVLVACQKETDQEAMDSPNETKIAEEILSDTDESEQIAFLPNEEAILTNEDGNEIFSLTINSVEEVSILEEDKEFIPQDSMQTVVVTYTYKYFNQEPDIDTINITPTDDLMVYDETGMAADVIGLSTGYFPFDSDNLDISPGRTAKSYKVFSLKNASEVVEIESSSINYGMVTFDANTIFKIPVEKP